jgi:hypothetical protein
MDVIDDVRGGTEQKVLSRDRNHRDRRLRGDAGYVSPDIMIEHHVADNEDPRPGKAVNDPGQSF